MINLLRLAIHGAHLGADARHRLGHEWLWRLWQQPEGVGLSPDEKFFYVTCETAGDVYAIDNKTYEVFAISSCIRARAAWRFCRTARARSFLPNPSAN